MNSHPLPEGRRLHPAVPESQLSKPDRLTPLQILTLVLSLLVLILMLVEAVMPLTPRQQRLIDTRDLIICIVFFLEFASRFRRAPNKLAFMKWGWIDLAASIPVVDSLRWGRLVRVVRILRLLRAFRSMRTLSIYFLRHEKLGSLGSILIVFGLVVSFASITVLYVEMDAPGATIRTTGDAVWWALVTVTTVGYGDFRPVTPEGRFLASLLMIAGVGLFGTLSGVVASLLVNPSFRSEESEIGALSREIRHLREKIESLEASLPTRPPRHLPSRDEDMPAG